MYNSLEQSLVYEFKKYNFLDLFKYKKKKRIKFKNKYDYNITIVFPGYKTKVYRDVVKSYDYRVDYNYIPISHVNIVIDLYNKSIQAPHLREGLELFIKQLAIKGMDIEINEFQDIMDYRFVNPDKNLLDYVNNIHSKLNKKYLIKGNQGKSYTLKELSLLIPLIVMQEDINYPMPYYEGRRMSFYRYIESIYCNDLDMLIQRTLSHDRPKLLEDLNYKEIIELPNYESIK